jgi:hypothetical protein
LLRALHAAMPFLAILLAITGPGTFARIKSDRTQPK